MAPRRSHPFAATLAMLLIAGTASATQQPSADFDAHVNQAMHDAGVPGLSIAVVQDGKVVMARGYGVRKLGSPEKVDADTIFPTGSTGKAITAAALAVLVDEGKIRWDDKVIDHIPWFRMYDPWVTNEITVRALRYIKPATSFRSGYAYDNVLYSVAGQLIEEVTGQTWEQFVKERVLKPAGMASSVTEQSARFANPNRAWPHARTGGRVRGMGDQHVLDERKTLGDNGAPAGGLSSSANDLSHWMQVQLGHGTWTNDAGKQVKVFSEDASQQMWTPVVVMPTPKWPGKLAEAAPKFSSYALGWNVRDYRGERVIEHGGAIFGVYTYIALFPDRNFGVAFQMNSEDVQVMRGLALELIDQ